MSSTYSAETKARVHGLVDVNYIVVDIPAVIGGYKAEGRCDAKGTVLCVVQCGRCACLPPTPYHKTQPVPKNSQARLWDVM